MKATEEKKTKMREYNKSERGRISLAKAHKKWVEKNREHLNKYAKLRRAKEGDKMRMRENDRYWAKKRSCVDCKSKERLEIDHLDYDTGKYEIRCRSCHLRRHNKREIVIDA